MSFIARVSQAVCVCVSMRACDCECEHECVCACACVVCGGWGGGWGGTRARPPSKQAPDPIHPHPKHFCLLAPIHSMPLTHIPPPKAPLGGSMVILIPFCSTGTGKWGAGMDVSHSLKSGCTSYSRSWCAGGVPSPADTATEPSTPGKSGWLSGGGGGEEGQVLGVVVGGEARKQGS